jgi:hypothetical protein
MARRTRGQQIGLARCSEAIRSAQNAFMREYNEAQSEGDVFFEALVPHRAA